MKNILIVNPFGIGDVLFTTPLLKAIKTSLPEAKIGFLCNRRVYPLIKDIPFIDWVFVYERDEMEDIRRRSLLLWLRAHRKLIGEIREKRFDAAIDLSLNTKFGAFLWLAGIKKRIGYDYKKRGKFLNYKIPLEGYKEKHIVEYYLDMLKHIDMNNLTAAKNYSLEVKKDFAFGKENYQRPYIAIAPGGGSSWGKDAFRKRWPEERFAELLNILSTNIQGSFFLVGSRKEREILEKIKSVSKKEIKIIDNLNLPEYAAFLKKMDILICNDGGPLHIAISVGTKTVSIFGPVDEKIYGPYPPDSQKHIVITKDLPCRPCYQNFRLEPCPYNLRCLREISAEEVFEAVKKLLK